MYRTRKVLGALPLLLAAIVAAGCGSDGGTSPATLEAISVAPDAVTLASGATQQFAATGHFSDGSRQPASVTWTSTGGSVSTGGDYTAGRTAGSFLVVATGQGGLADTASVTIPAPPPPDLIAVELTPAAVTVVSGQTQSFTATGRLSDNSTTTVPVTWTATGGSVSAGGVYTAGPTAGNYQVITTELGGAGFADTATVTVTAAAPTLVAIQITTDSARVHARDTVTITAVGRYSDNSTVSVPVTWSTTAPSTAGTIAGTGKFTAGERLGLYKVIATQQGGTLADTVPIVVFETAGVTISGPTFYLPVSPSGPTVGTAAVHLCTGNHFTDDPAGLGGVATVTASPNVGVLAPAVTFTTTAPVMYADGSGEVSTVCQKVWEAPGGLVGNVTVTISVASNRPGSGMAKIFTYASDRVPPPTGRADFSHDQDFTPGMTTGTVTESYVVSAGVGANIWFKSTRVP